MPLESLAPQVTIVTPPGKILPEAGLHVIVGLGSQLSVAVTSKFTGSPAELVADTAKLPGHFITGGVMSDVEMHGENSDVLPRLSVAVAVKRPTAAGRFAVNVPGALMVVEPRKV